MTHQAGNRARRFTGLTLAAAALVIASQLPASDHLDTSSVVADPRADIGDLFAWTSYEGRRLNLVMTIVGHTFSDQLQYVFQLQELAPKEQLHDRNVVAFRRQRLCIDPRAQVLMQHLRQGVLGKAVETLEAETLTLMLVRRALGHRTLQAAREPWPSEAR